MSEDRKKLVASPVAVERVKQLGPSPMTPVESVREVTGGQYVTARAARSGGQRDNVGGDAPQPQEIGLQPTGELEPGVKQSLVEAVSNLFGGALKIKVGKLRKAVDEIERKAAQDTSTAGPTRRRSEIAGKHLGVKAPKSPDKPHKIRGTLDAYGVHFTKSEREFFEKFVKDAEQATAVNITARYSDMPGGGGSAPRSGHISEVQSMAHARFYFVWRKLGPQFQTICGAAVLEVRSETLGRPFTLEEIGAQATNYTDKALCRAAALGMTKASLWRLAELYLEWNGMDESAQQVIREANDEIEAAKNERLGRVSRGRNNNQETTNAGTSHAGEHERDLKNTGAPKALGTY